MVELFIGPKEKKKKNSPKLKKKFHRCFLDT